LGQLQQDSSTSLKPSSSQKKRIFVVDDEVDITTVFKLGLEEADLQVDVYNDPLLALSDYKPGMYDLLLLDIKMPKMNGFELYQEMKEIDNKVKVCFVTASELFYEEFREDHFINEKYLILKPMKNKEMIERINRIISLENPRDY
jgi:DNA-binding response OmpR family regulator